MQILINPPAATWNELIKRPQQDEEEILRTVREILNEVKTEGDRAVKKFSTQFDGVNREVYHVSNEELDRAVVSENLKQAIDTAASNIAKFHKSQEERRTVVETMPGVRCWRKSVAIEKIGLYIPSGTAPLFSSLLMLAIPAKIAGCGSIIVCTPPAKEGAAAINPVIAYCCKLLGITEVFAVGGAQAIAAMAFGTETVPKVQKIFGPGNQFVTAAKKAAVEQGVAIDIPAGPSELLVIADESANPEYIAADLLSQAEHGEDSQVILIANSEKAMDKIQAGIDGQICRLDRQHIARASLEKSKALVFSNLSDAVSFSNLYAPEHLILAIKEPYNVSEHIKNAGSVFLGEYSPEAAGDYASGTNHTLPTNGYAAAYSGVSLDSFVKKITFQEISREGLKNLAPVIEAMAEAEGLDGHKEAVAIRFRNG